MSRTRMATTAAAVAGLLAGQLAIFTAPATAGDWGHPRYGSAHPVPRQVAPPRHYGYGHQAPRHRDRSGDAVAGAILGIGALIVGAAIADAARHERRPEPRYERDDD